MAFLLYMIIAMIAVSILTPISLTFLRRLKFGQFVRDDGPQSHLAKAGTPTMGGLVFISVILIMGLVASMSQPAILPILLVSFAFGIIGFIDDYIKVVMKRSMGFRAYQKLIAQLAVAGGYAYYMLVTSANDTSIIVPFFESLTVNLGWLYIPFVIFFILGTVNGANFTDGVDGLATSVTIAILSCFAVVSVLINSDISLLFALSIGSLFGFLIYNSHPAKLFMGDTGSLFLGGLVAAIAVYFKMPLLIVLVGIIYLAEVISVILQVGYFKISGGKRIFRMAPLHHHYEEGGWKETKVVYVFTIVTVFLGLISLVGVYLYLGIR